MPAPTNLRFKVLSTRSSAMSRGLAPITPPKLEPRQGTGARGFGD